MSFQITIGKRDIRKAYRPFKNKLTFTQFTTKFNQLSTDKKRFLRASSLYQQSQKCGKCEPNVSMALLCSCADSLKLHGINTPRRNIMTFYNTYCPISLRHPPIQYHPRCDVNIPMVNASFGNALDYIYEKYRNLFIHEGKGRLRKLPKGTIWIGSTLLDKFHGDCYVIDDLRILSWFSDVTRESLYAML
jgi:hypothetical protein